MIPPRTRNFTDRLQGLLSSPARSETVPYAGLQPNTAPARGEQEIFPLPYELHSSVSSRLPNHIVALLSVLEALKIPCHFDGKVIHFDYLQRVGMACLEFSDQLALRGPCLKVEVHMHYPTREQRWALSALEPSKRPAFEAEIKMRARARGERVLNKLCGPALYAAQALESLALDDQPLPEFSLAHMICASCPDVRDAIVKVFPRLRWVLRSGR